MDRFFSSTKNSAAWAVKAKAHPFEVSKADYSPPPKDHVIVKVFDVAVNPIDWKMQDTDLFNMKYPTVFGTDVAGEIAEIGDGVEDLRIGQRVIAYCNSLGTNDAAQGGFQKFVVVYKDAIAELPDAIATSNGVVLPLGISTAAAGLYQKDGYLELPYPSEDPKKLDRTLLVWGGSSSVGSCVIQLAIASGVNVITTASPKNFDYCRALGASQCFDYRSKDVESELIDALKGKTLVGAYDAVGEVEACARVVDRVEGKTLVVSVGTVPKEGIPSSVRAKQVYAASIFQNDVGHFVWRKFLPKALAKHIIKPKPDALIVGEELKSVQAGVDKQKKGVSAQKVVVANISA